MDDPFKVGDLVTVHSGPLGFGCDRSTAHVTRVLKASIVLDDGSRWHLDGRPKPRRSGFRQPRVLRANAGDLAHIERHELTERITTLTQRPYGGDKPPVAALSLDQLRRICAVASESVSAT